MNAVNILSVSQNVDSAKVRFLPVPGAKDYAIWDVANPNNIKYGGLWHLDADNGQQWSSLVFNMDSQGNMIYDLTKPWPGITTVQAPKWVAGNPGTASPNGLNLANHHADVPALEIEINGLGPGPHTLVVAALDAVGPFPYQALYDSNNARINALDANCDTTNGMCALGSNMGCSWAGDGAGKNITITNGQGNYQNNPNVIAQSWPFTVIAAGALPLPSQPSATQAFCDTFPSGAFTTPTNVNPITGTQKYTMTTPAGVWDVQTSNADTDHTIAFIHRNHLMNVLFDGGTPSATNATHIAHGVHTFSPQRTADFSNGQILHLTMEVDSHTDGRRWIGFNISPANDPLISWDATAPPMAINASNIGVFMQLNDLAATLTQFAGFNATGAPINQIVCGSAGGSTLHAGYRNLINYQYGHGLDNRSRIDLFLSQTHFSIYEDGACLCEYDLPTPLPFTKAKAYFTSYLYHSALEQNDLKQYKPFEDYWINKVPFSDERHWDNMGFEVLPASTAWSSLGALIKMPVAQSPVYAPPATAPSFSLSAAPASVAQGSTAASNIALMPQGGFTGIPTLAAIGAPPGLNVMPSGLALQISASSSVAPGTYPITITGTSGALVASVVIFVTVTAAAPATDPLQAQLNAANATIAADNTIIAALKAKIAAAQKDLQ